MDCYQIKVCNAVINSPIGGPDTTYKFTAGLVMSVPLDAEISHLHSTKPLRLRLRYPDQQTHLIVPRIDHLRPDQFYSGILEISLIFKHISNVFF